MRGSNVNVGRIEGQLWHQLRVVARVKGSKQVVARRRWVESRFRRWRGSRVVRHSGSCGASALLSRCQQVVGAQ